MSKKKLTEEELAEAAAGKRKPRRRVTAWPSGLSSAGEGAPWACGVFEHVDPAHDQRANLTLAGRVPAPDRGPESV